jgi:dTMP kinase
MEEFTMTKNKGKLIVIDGTDGSGKATQVALLSARLKKEGYTVKNVDFPEYYENFFGKFIGHCLSEQYYNFVKVHPKIASVLYAADRFESKDKMTQWLSKGYIIIANRYVSANQIHQGGKIKSAVKRQAFIEWLDEMEYKVFKIPRPAIVFYLDLPVKLSKKLMLERNKTQSRAYLGTKKDLVEKDMEYIENSHKSALWLAKTQKNYVKVECAQKDIILPREAIHEIIYGKIKKIVK